MLKMKLAILASVLLFGVASAEYCFNDVTSHCSGQGEGEFWDFI